MFVPTPTSAISIERISYAVPASRPRFSTSLEMSWGFSRTPLYVSLEPMARTIPSPTRAMMVSSVAPPTKRSKLERTVTRARARTVIPSFATPSIVPFPESVPGQSITLGFTLVRTASNTVFPEPDVAKSIAQHRLKSSLMPALSAAMRARIT